MALLGMVNILTDINDGGIALPHESLALVGFSKSVFTAHHQSNMSLKPEFAKSVTKVTDNRLEFDIC